jgi:hypothetical protein
MVLLFGFVFSYYAYQTYFSQDDSSCVLKKFATGMGPRKWHEDK